MKRSAWFRTRTNDPHLARCGSVLIGQIKKEPEFTCFCCLSPWVGIKQAAKHLFTMSKDPVTDALRHQGHQTCSLTMRRFSVVFGAGLAAPSLAAKGSEAWWSRTESNRRHPACKAGALPTELRPHSRKLVGPGGLEPPTSRLSGVRSNHLSYGPSGSRQKTSKLAGERYGPVTARMLDA